MEKYLEIVKGRKIRIQIREAEIKEESPLGLEFTVERQPYIFQEKDDFRGVAVELSRFDNFVQEVEQYKDLPRAIQCQQIIELLHRHLSYEVLKEDKISLWEAFQKGKADCKCFAILFHLLASHLGMKTIITGVDMPKGVLQNILRRDNRQPLFKTVPLGPVMTSHVWNDILFKGRWVPIDPTAKVNGFYEEQLQIFHDANYMEYSGSFVDNLNPRIPATVVLLLPHSIIFPFVAKHAKVISELMARKGKFRGNLDFVVWGGYPGLTLIIENVKFL